MRFICTRLAAFGLLLWSVGCGRSAPAPSPAPSKPPATGIPGSQTVLRIHFVGCDALSKSTNATVLRKVLELPTTARIRGELRDRLEATVLKYPSPERTTAFRGMFDDLLNRESVYASYQSQNKKIEWALALRLSSERVDAWRAALDPAHFSEPLVPFVPNGTAVQRSGEWLLAGWPGTNSVAWREVAKQIQVSKPANSNQLLEIDANPSRLSQVLKLPLLADLPSIHLEYTGKGENVHTEGRLTFDQPIQSKMESWNVPTNIVNDPLISFTAAQGISKWIEKHPAFKQMFPTRVPNQMFVWARSDVPFQTFFGLPLQGAGTEIKPVASKVQDFLTAHEGFGEVKLATNGLHFWIERSPVPLLGLFVGAGKDADREFLLGGLGDGLPPAGSAAKAPPAALVANVNGHPDLLYYDWEITSERLSQLRIAAASIWILAMEPPPSFVPAGSPWLDSLNGILGNTITEITDVSPRELKLVRSSHIGFTAAELIALTKWLESPAFPELKLPNFSGKPMLPKK